MTPMACKKRNVLPDAGINYPGLFFGFADGFYKLSLYIFTSGGKSRN
jgi:hypothetical protein